MSGRRSRRGTCGWIESFSGRADACWVFLSSSYGKAYSIGDVFVPSVFFMEGSILQDILERRIDKCDEEMEILEKSTNKKEDAETRNFTSTLANTSSLFGMESIVAEGGK
ncbi:hypothetical protein L6452_36262 [Arctium lappa]|uniref:Uncharacterized protein n=1 Tax=Arctium lappa TaxID=4217 RepID=A0ACB8Y9K7_ARCLA|nr:hypothetical protein L6452_36262 [Arctium lappa]